MASHSVGYTGAELSDMTGVPLGTIRFWYRQGLLPPLEGRGHGRNSYFTVKHYHRIEDIKRMKDNNRLNEDIRDYFKMVDEGLME